MTRVLFLLLFLLIAGCGEGPPSKSGPIEDATDNAVDASANDMADMNIGDDGNMSMDMNASDEPPPIPANASDPSDDAVAQGTGAFIEPDDMEIGDWGRIEFIVGAGETAAAQESAVSQEAGGKELASKQQVYVSPSMRVTLQEDPSFEIRAVGESLKKLGLDQAATWQWNVKPLTDGERELTAKVEVHRINPDGSAETLDEYTRRVEVRVRVGTWQGFMNALTNASSLGDALGTLFRSWEKTLLALAALLVAAFTVAKVIKSRGGK